LKKERSKLRKEKIGLKGLFSFLLRVEVLLHFLESHIHIYALRRATSLNMFTRIKKCSLSQLTNCTNPSGGFSQGILSVPGIAGYE